MRSIGGVMRILPWKVTTPAGGTGAKENVRGGWVAVQKAPETGRSAASTMTTTKPISTLMSCPANRSSAHSKSIQHSSIGSTRNRHRRLPRPQRARLSARPSCYSLSPSTIQLQSSLLRLQSADHVRQCAHAYPVARARGLAVQLRSQLLQRAHTTRATHSLSALQRSLDR